jgi:hypothetical protein
VHDSLKLNLAKNKVSAILVKRMILHSDVDGWKLWFQVHACARDNTLSLRGVAMRLAVL